MAPIAQAVRCACTIYSYQARRKNSLIIRGSLRFRGLFPGFLAGMLRLPVITGMSILATHFPSRLGGDLGLWKLSHNFLERCLAVEVIPVMTESSRLFHKEAAG